MNIMDTIKSIIAYYVEEAFWEEDSLIPAIEEELGDYEAAALNCENFIVAPAEDGTIEVDINGKRKYRIIVEDITDTLKTDGNDKNDKTETDSKSETVNRDTSTLYLVEVGVLIAKGEPNFEDYSTVYDRKYGYYDENQLYAAELSKAKEYVNDYVKDGVDNTYGVITKSNGFRSNLTDKEIAEMPVEGEEYADVEYSVCKRTGGQIEENFITMNFFYRLDMDDGSFITLVTELHQNRQFSVESFLKALVEAEKLSLSEAKHVIRIIELTEEEFRSLE